MVYTGGTTNEGEELEEGEIAHEKYNPEDPFIDMDEYINDVDYLMNYVKFVEYYDLMRAYGSKFQEYEQNVKN